MLETKDPAIMLFGMKISLPHENDSIVTSAHDVKSKKVEHVPDKETVEQNEATIPKDEEAEPLGPSVETNSNKKTSSRDDDCPKPKDSETEEKQDEAADTQDKPLKKPDKILPCPRCNSMDTKFCYYNNYNVNQPRHFCKACQRYWTAGGTMRNVPVGAGRRKNKNSSSHFRHITISEALHAARFDLPYGTGHPALKSNGRVLSFGMEAPNCESMASMLNVADKNLVNSKVNGLHKHDVQKVHISPGKSGEIGDECTSGSSSSSEEGGKNPRKPPTQNINAFHTQMPYLQGVPWTYSWNPPVPPPAFCPPGYPMPIYPPAFWNGSVQSTLSTPWLNPNSLPPQKSPSSSPTSPLGKHPREEDQCKQKTPNRCIVIPKTLRIDDPAEAAKSSIWATLGIKNESISNGGMFKGFHSKSEGKKNVAEPYPILQANPVAFSRSLKFQERV